MPYNWFLGGLAAVAPSILKGNIKVKIIVLKQKRCRCNYNATFSQFDIKWTYIILSIYYYNSCLIKYWNFLGEKKFCTLQFKLRLKFCDNTLIIEINSFVTWQDDKKIEHDKLIHKTISNDLVCNDSQHPIAKWMGRPNAK